MKTCVVFVLTICMYTVSVLSCDHGWRAHDGMCYHLGNDTESYMNAKAVCEMFDGWLVEIETMEENQYLTEQVLAFRQVFWIGLTDLEIEGTWLWMTSQTGPAFFNWVEDAPENEDDIANCVILNPNGFWNDIPCNARITYICEKEDTM